MNSSTSKIDVVVLVGPTASGKTGLLDRVFGRGVLSFQAETGLPSLPEAVVIGADSMQAYRGMDIGTAKPDPELRATLEHRLVDIREPSVQFTAGEFAALARLECEKSAKAGKLPIICGGTGFYVKTYLCGTPPAPPADPEIRKQVAKDLESLGVEALREELSKIDPASASRIHVNDVYRITRALEIVRMTEKPLAAFLEQREAVDFGHHLVLSLSVTRPVLVRRIEERTDAMFRAGLVEEVRHLVRVQGFSAGDPGMKAIGYREFFHPETGQLLDLENAVILKAIRDKIALDTRQYAKRQETFFRSIPMVRMITPDPHEFARILRQFLDKDT